MFVCVSGLLYRPTTKIIWLKCTHAHTNAHRQVHRIIDSLGALKNNIAALKAWMGMLHGVWERPKMTELLSEADKYLAINTKYRSTCDCFCTYPESFTLI